MPSLVDEETLTISPAANGPLLLEGPKNLVSGSDNSEISLSDIKDTKSNLDDPYDIPLDLEPGVGDKESVLLFGFYQVPQHSTIKLSPAHTSLRLPSTNSYSGIPNGHKVLPPFFPDLYPPPEKGN